MTASGGPVMAFCSRCHRLVERPSDDLPLKMVINGQVVIDPFVCLECAPRVEPEPPRDKVLEKTEAEEFDERGWYEHWHRKGWRG